MRLKTVGDMMALENDKLIAENTSLKKSLLQLDKDQAKP